MGVEQEHDHWMKRAVELAKRAAINNEVPVGALLVKENKLLAESWNQSIANHDPTAHAEIQVIRLAAKNLNNYRLINTTLYVTLEPCLMCYGALVNARVERLVFGAFDKRFGSIESIRQHADDFQTNHKIEIVSGVLEEVCAGILKNYFRQKRQKHVTKIAQKDDFN